MSYCSKPACPNRAAVVLGYDYAARLVVLADAEGEISPHSYALCVHCAEALHPPRGWVLEDRRMRPALFVDSGLRTGTA